MAVSQTGRRTVDFRNTIIIMTSNLGTDGLRRQPLGLRPDNRDEQDEISALREWVDAALKRTFRPEFLNRIDETIVFHPLNQNQIIEIVELMVRDVQCRLEERQLTFELTTDAEHWLAKEGFDPLYGARPLRRAIQRQLENPLSKLSLSGEVPTGEHVVVDTGSEGLTFCKGDRPRREECEPLEVALV